MKDRRYFVAGGESLAVAEEFINQRVSASNELRALMESLGAEEARWGDCGVDSMSFPVGVKPPEGLARRRDGWWGPGRGKSGKAIREHWRTIRDPSVARFTLKLFPDHQFPGFVSEDGRSVHYATCGRVGDRVVISMPAFVDRIPAGATPIKRSEYYAMMEAEEEADETLPAAVG